MTAAAGLRLLLVEDDPNDAELVRACLEEATRTGAEIVHAASLADGLRALDARETHVTVLDLDLPDSSGFETLERVRAAARGPVIVVTGNPHPGLAREVLKRGAYDVLQKSELDARSLMRLVRLASLQSEAEASLRLTERYRALVENSREAIALLGGGGELLYGNPALHAMLWRGANLIELVHPFEREALRTEYARLAATPERRATFRAHFRHADGSWRMLEATLHNRLRDGGVAAVIANFIDITAHADLEERFRATFDQAAVGIAHVANDGRFQLVNRKLCEILGYSREELSALTMLDVSHPEDHDVTGALRRKMRARDIESFSIIKRYLRKGGATVWIELTVSLVRTADGAPSYEIALFEDISARRQAEQALQRSERRFRALIENSSDGILLADGEGRMTYSSPGARRTLGYAKGETLGLQVAELVHPDERAAFEQTLASARVRPGVTHALRVRARHKNGAYRLLEATCTDLTADESVRAILFNYRDITEREEAQARARRMSLMYAALSAANEASAQLKDEQELYQRICDIAVRLGGLKLAAMRLLEPGSEWLRAAASAGEPASYIAKTRVSIDASIPEGQGLAALAMRENRSTVSNDFLAEPRLGPWWDAAREAGLAAAACIPLRRGGRPSGLLVLYSGETGWFDAEVIALAERMAANLSHALDALDLDAARRASEQDLREGEERIRTIVDSANEGILVYDREHRIVAGNPAAARIIGVPVAEMLGKPGFTSLFPCVHEDGSPLAPEDRPTRLTLRAGPLTDHIVGIVRPGGATTWVSVNTAFLRRPGEAEHYGLVSTIADVTAQRTAELALRESEDRFRKLTALSSDWYWEQDDQFRFIELTGSGAQALANGSPSNYLGKARWETPDLELLEGDWVQHRAMLQRHESFKDVVLRRRMTDGTQRYMSISGEPMFDAGGRFKGYRGVARNVTEKVRAEEALRRFRVALDASVDAIFLIDAEAMRMIDVNDAAARNLGYRREELVGLSPSLLFTDRSDGDLRAAYEGLASQEGRTDVYRAHYRRKDGGLLPVEITQRIVTIGERSYVVGVARDISERLKTEERLEQSVERFEIVARATNDVVWDWNLITDQVWWNENFQKVFGYAPYEIGAYIDSWASRIHPDEVDAVKQAIRGAIDRGDKAWSGEYRFRRKDGSFAHVLDRGLLIQDSGGRPVRMIGAMVDVTARKATERRLQLHAQRQEELARIGQFALRETGLDEVFAEAVRVLQSGLCDVAAIIEQVNEEGWLRIAAARGGGAEASVGKSAQAGTDSKWRTAIEAPGAVLSDRAYFESRPADQPWAYWLRRMGSGVYVAIHGERAPFGFLTMNSLRDGAFDEEDLRFAEAVANVLSGTVRRHQTQTRLAYMAEFDVLTGLPNRNLLQDRLHQSVAQAQRRGWQGAVLFIDLDRFKLVNDTLGHHFGDALIAQVGQRLKRCVRAGDTVGRVSGDEFGVVLSDLAQADDAALVAQKILDTLAHPFDLGGNEAYVTASIGISVFPGDGADAETLLKNADMAMYRAKELTRNAYCFFTAEMNQRSVAKLQLNTDLRRAIERREFVLHYQPKVDLRDRRVLGIEALLRWAHPTRGMVSPAEFIPALEDSGLILPVGEWVLEEAALQLARWQLAGLAAVPVAVNLSAKQFRRRDLDAQIARALAAAGVASGLIELEITESCLMEDPEDAVRLLASLRGAGLRISVDDFGTGYSSLSYLTRLPLNALKIDRSFVRDVVLNGEAASIVRAVIDMAHNLTFTVIAEGVETEQQFAFLRRHGCDLGQGYLFDPPVSAAELAQRLRRAA